MIEHKQMDIATKDWLTELDCEVSDIVCLNKQPLSNH